MSEDQKPQNPATEPRRRVTTDLLAEFTAWTLQADMFRSSPQGRAFGQELREVFKLAAERYGQLHGWGSVGR